MFHMKLITCQTEYFYVPVLDSSPVNLQHSSYKQAFSGRVKNCVDPDQMASSNLDLHCFQKRVICLFDLIFTSHQQSFSYIGTGLPGLNQY